MKPLSTFIVLIPLLLSSISLAEPEQEPEKSAAENGEAQPFVPPPSGIYRTYDKHGNPVFTDRPLEHDSVEKIGELNSSTPLNSFKSNVDVEEAKQRLEQDAVKREQREQSAADKWKQRDLQLKRQLDHAKKAHALGQDTKEGDFIGYRTKTGGQACCRPSPQRLERLKQLEENMKKAQQELITHRRQNPKTYRGQ